MNKLNVDQYARARSNLLGVLMFTLLNVILAVFEADVMFLFSATIPYFFTVVAIYWEVYGYLVLVAVILLIYFACWFFSKKNVVWMIVALVLFIIDSIFMLLMYLSEFDSSAIVNLIFHIWVIYYLVTGVIYRLKAKKQSKTEEIVEEVSVEEVSSEEALKVANTSPIRLADEDVKAKIFLEEEILGRKVVYRRVGKVNELVINGKVYDEYEALVEMPHSLLANIEGHLIEARYDRSSYLYIIVDNEIIKKKLRLI